MKPQKTADTPKKTVPKKEILAQCGSYYLCPSEEWSEGDTGGDTGPPERREEGRETA